MSAETTQWLNTQTLIGDTAVRGNAWHYRAEDQGDESNHYDGAVPVEDVRRRLLDWTPLEGEITASVLTDDGVSTYTDPTRKAIIHSRTGEFLGVFKNSYTVHGYDQWLIGNVEAILDSDLHIGSAGLLKGGAVCWVQMDMPGTIEAAGDQIRPFITAATSLDGSLATTYLIGATRVVCDNWLSMALASATQTVKIRHSSKSIGRLSEIRDALQIVHTVGDEFTAEIEKLYAEKVSWQRFGKWVDHYAGLAADGKALDLSPTAARFANERKDGLIQLWKDDERVTPWKGTAWGVVQTANTYEHHIAWAEDDQARAARNTDRMIRGKVADIDTKALALLAAV